MSATIEQLNKLQRIHHSNCWICGKSGMGLEFAIGKNGEVTAEIDCQNIHQGYDGILHGGIIASLLDSAMVNCLFAHGIAALTAELKVRFKHPVKIEGEIVVEAELRRSHGALFILKSRLSQNSAILAEGTGKFIKKD